MRWEWGGEEQREAAGSPDGPGWWLGWGPLSTAGAWLGSTRQSRPLFHSPVATWGLYPQPQQARNAPTL